MDLQLILRVLWRFKLIVGVGIVLAITLATLSYIKLPTGGKIEYRQAEQWESLSTLFVTSSGFPWGSLGTSAPGAPAASGEAKPTPNSLDPAHLTGLAALYVRLATADPVMKAMERDGGPIDGTLAAFPVSSDDAGNGSVLPMVTLSAIAPTSDGALALAHRHAKAFVEYLEREQRKAGIPQDERVVVQVVRQPQEPELLMGRKKTRPIVVFVAVMIAVMGLAFALENLRPRVRVLPSREATEAEAALLAPVAPASSRRSA